MRYEARNILLRLYQQQEDVYIRDILKRLLSHKGNLTEVDVQLLTQPLVSDEDVKWPNETGNFKDARVQSLAFINFRAFPNNKYGLHFTQKKDNKDEVCSLFLVGSNSNGKSTICEALEYAYTGDVASVHRLNGIDLQKYLTYGFEEGGVKKEEVRLMLKVVGSQEPTTINLTTPIEPYCTASCFCSDSDVEEMERSEENIEGYLLRQLGYGELPLLKKKLEDIADSIETNIKKVNSSALSATDLRKVIHAFLRVHHSKYMKTNALRLMKKANLSKLVREMRDKNTLLPKETSKADRLSVIRNSFKRIPDDYFVEEWNQLISNVTIDVQSPAKVGVKPMVPMSPGSKVEDQEGVKRPDPVKEVQDRLQMLYERLGKVLEDADGLDKIYEELASSTYSGLIDLSTEPEKGTRLSQYAIRMKQLSMLLEDEMGSIRDSFYKENKDYLASTMASFSPSSEIFTLVNEGGHLSAKISSTENGGFTGSPKSYYNTFRYKLFVIALKISLAFLYMRNRKVVVPIVIDDVFNATDFDNSIKLERFVYHIYKTYGEKVGTDIPLQLIVLSHDEMVMTAFRRGAKLIKDHKCLDNKQLIAVNDFICGRLFHYSQSDIIMKQSNIKSDFANLYLPI